MSTPPAPAAPAPPATLAEKIRAMRVEFSDCTQLYTAQLMESLALEVIEVAALLAEQHEAAAAPEIDAHERESIRRKFTDEEWMTAREEVFRDGNSSWWMVAVTAIERLQEELSAARAGAREAIQIADILARAKEEDEQGIKVTDEEAAPRMKELEDSVARYRADRRGGGG